jgi:uncharacterized protein YcfL
MKMFSKLSFLALLVLIIGCSSGTNAPPKPKPEQVLIEKFWAAVFTNGIESAQQYTTKASQAMIASGVNVKFEGQYTLYELDSDGENAIAYIQLSNGDEWPTILVKVNYEWKVDFVQMMDEMFGADLPTGFATK